MPPIRRHIAANIPALAGGDGKPCFRTASGRPVYQCPMRIDCRFGSGLDCSPLFMPDGPFDGYSPSDFRATSFSAAEIATAFAERDMWDQAAYGDMEEDFLVFNLGGAYIWRDTAGDDLKRLRFYARAGLVWEAAAWHWEVKIEELQVGLYDEWGQVQVAYLVRADTTLHANSAIYKSASSQQAFRLGNGLQLAFDALTGTPDAGVADMLQGTTITLSAQAA